MPDALSPRPNRFWKTTAVSKEGSLYRINLDAKPLKTPGGNLISCESQGLALLVQAEWDAMHKIIKPSSLPITSVSVIDS
jgi:chaperone required for assembly of F1-ATPase